MLPMRALHGLSGACSSARSRGAVCVSGRAPYCVTTASPLGGVVIRFVSALYGGYGGC